MADLSQLSDEQLDAYRSLLQQKQQPTAASAQPTQPLPTFEKINRFASNFAEAANPFPGIGRLATHPIQTVRDINAAGQEEANKAREEFGRGHYMESFGHGLASVLPIVGPAAAHAGEQIGSGDIAGGLGSAAGTTVPLIAAPSTMEGIGKGMQRAAEPVAEAAMRIPGKAKAFGATPGRAILEETSGVRPSTVEQTARQQIGNLSGQLGVKAQLAATPVDLSVARSRIRGAMQTAEQQNAPGIRAQLQPLEESLTTRFAPPGPIPTQLPVSEALDLRRGFGKEHVQFKPNPLAPRFNDVNEAAKGAYHDLTEAIHRAAPGTEELDQRIQSLIPVRDRARLTDLNQGAVQRTLGKIARPTGVLIGPLAGYHFGGPVGAAAGLLLPEMLSSPTAQMSMARGLFGGGKLIRSPLAKGVGRIAPALSATPSKEQ